MLFIVSLDKNPKIEKYFLKSPFNCSIWHFPLGCITDIGGITFDNRVYRLPVSQWQTAIVRISHFSSQIRMQKNSI